jgi:hypothetical protein
METNSTGVAMTCIADQAPIARRAYPSENFWQKLSLVFRRKRKSRLPRLDPRDLSDHMKRDLGFIDGRG